MMMLNLVNLTTFRLVAQRGSFPPPLMYWEYRSRR
ncbi:hypothetical protein AF47_01996 [Klebsiella aerogenes MGH 61]|nr:hypothetical protein AF47_01996 [Klebsiella aerogenes MGH 61]